MIFYAFLIISSLLLGSSFARIIATYLVNQRGIDLFAKSLSLNIPSFDLELARAKSFDMIQFVSFLLISSLLFAIFYFIYRKRKLTQKTQIVFGSIFAIFALFVYVATSFASYSGTQTIVFSAIWYAILFASSLFIPKELPSFKMAKREILNGIIAGFFLLIVFNNITTSIALSLSVFAGTPLLFYILSDKFKFLKHPAIALLILSFAFPFNRVALLSVVVATGVAVYLTRNKITPKILALTDKIYPLLILFIFLYNPIFYLGNFDSIEEGFWAGWLERLLRGQIMYKDFAAYHPPLLLGGLFAFSKVFGASLYDLRLYFHILQIAGLAIIYYILDRLVESKWIKIGIFVLIMSYSFGLVRNNMEIRVGSAVLPLLFVYMHSIKKGRFWLFAAGLFSALSFFISIETGISSLVAVSFATLLVSKKKTFIGNFTKLITGMLTGSVPILTVFLAQGSLYKFFEYIFYYASTFSSGYQNYPMSDTMPQTLIQWFLVSKYISSSGFMFNLSVLTLLGAFLTATLKKVRKTFNPKDILIAGLAVFGLILARSALGRSDAYHVAFIWIISIIIIGYFLQQLNQISKGATAAILCIMLLFISREAVQFSFIQNQLVKFQTYGNPSGGYPSYSLKRAGIITGIDVNPRETDSLVNYIDAHVNYDKPIFVFPQEPEVYFLADRNDSTEFDTPTAFYTPDYQEKMISQLKQNPPELIIYRKDFQTQGFTSDTLHGVNEYINGNYKTIETFGKDSVMVHI